MAKETKEKAKEEAKPKVQGNIVRMAGRDINGDKKISEALREIKGIGHTMAHAISLHLKSSAGLDYNLHIGELTDEQIAKVDSAVRDATNSSIPSYLFNRRMEMQTGKDMHLVGTDLIVKEKQDIDNDIKLQTWRGIRHRTGQKVRGQRTRSTGRTGATIGVMKKAAKQQLAAAATATSAAEKK